MNRKMILFTIILVCFVLSLTSNPIIAAKPPKDVTPPAVTITSPVDGAIVSGIQTISFTATDDNPITGYEIYIDDVLYAESSSYSWDTSVASNGIHIILCRAKDNSKNWGEDSISVTVDNSGSNSSPGSYDDAFKVMSYNIEASGANENWKEVVKEENPDILILVETGTWDDNGNYTLNQVVNEFNTYFINEVPYIGYCAQGITYETDGEAILSRFPVLEFNQIPIVKLDDNSDYDVTHDFIDAVVDIDGTPVHILGAHLKAMSGSDNEWRRERETEGIINYMDSLGDVPVMYMGDLNSFSPDDTGDLAPSGDLGYGPMTMMLYPDDPTYGQYSSAIHTFTDVFRTLNPTDPGYTYGHQDPQYTSRIDFMVVNSFFANRLINSTTGDTPSADIGSDHYSVDMFVAWNFTSTPDSIPPAKVTGLLATPVSMSQIDLTWSPNSESDLSHYRVYRDGVLITQVYENSYSDTGLSPATTYTYEVSAVDSSLNEGPYSDAASATTNDGGSADLVVINEFLPDPYVAYSEEWIELYNPQDLEADLSGYILDDITSGGTNPYQIPAGTVISGKGFLVFYQSDTGIGLNNAGDTVNLLKPDGSTVVDSHSYSSSSNDVSIGRETDGSSIWVTFDSPTPGASNGASGGNADAVVLNEFLPDPYTLYSEEWIELYNPLDVEVDVSGYILDDITSGGTSPYTIPAGTTIPANGFIVFYQSTTGIAMNNDGDTVNFISPDGTTVLDSYSYSSSSNDVSYGRTTDGGSTWTTFTSPTPGSSNSGGSQLTKIHVQDISFTTYFAKNGKTEYLEITVTVVDENGQPVAGVTVTGQLTLPSSEVIDYSDVTDTSGKVVFTYSVRNSPLSTGTYTFTVTDLSGTNYEYDPAANVETSDSWTKQ